ncbi:unnamed protein product [Boreogadus saida]
MATRIASLFVTMATQYNNRVTARDAETERLRGFVKKSSQTTMAPAVNMEMVPLFKGRREQNVVFLLDTSENMKSVLGPVKQLLIQALLARFPYRESLFNLMAISSKLNRWSQTMLPCAPGTVYEALSWVHSLTCGPGGDLLAALSVALMDPDCNAVHLVTAGLPCNTDAVLHALPAVTDGRTVNFFYVLDQSSPWFNSVAQDVLRCPALATRGSCYLIPVGSDGALMGKVVPFHMTESLTSAPTSCSGTSVPPSIHIPHQHTSPPFFRCSLGNHPVTSCLPCDLTPHSSRISSGCFPGCRVLARRQQDGLYYPGTAILECRRGLWLVESELLEGASTVSEQQLVCSLDMIPQTGAHAGRLVPGDAVMTPWEPGVGRPYGPGLVTAVIEHQDSLNVADGGPSLWVRMWSGCVALVPQSLVVHVSSSDYSRLVQEQGGPGLSHSWPCPPTPPWAHLRGCQSTPAACYGPPLQGRCAWAGPLGGVGGCERAKLEEEARLLLENLAATEMLRSRSSLATAEGVTIGVSLPTFRPKGDQNRPPWRYWRRSTPEPQHRKPGTPAARRAIQPARSSLPMLQVSLSPNPSSMFQTVAASVRRADIRAVFEGTHFQPRPPTSCKTNAATAVHLRMNCSP